MNLRKFLRKNTRFGRYQKNIRRAFCHFIPIICKDFFPSLNRHLRTFYVNQKKLSEQTLPKEHSLLYLLYLLKKYLIFFLFQPNYFLNFLLMPKFNLYIFLFFKSILLIFFKEIKVLNKLLLMNFPHLNFLTVVQIFSLLFLPLPHERYFMSFLQVSKIL